jgi:hypothetical protein
VENMGVYARAAVPGGVLRQLTGRGRRSRAAGPEGPAVCQAAAALPHRDRRRAAEALRDQLRIVAVAGGRTPDWGSLAVTGPIEVTSTRHGVHFEWTGRVAVNGPAPVLLPDPDVVLQHPWGDDATMPFRVDGTWPDPSDPEEARG